MIECSNKSTSGGQTQGRTAASFCRAFRSKSATSHSHCQPKADNSHWLVGGCTSWAEMNCPVLMLMSSHNQILQTHLTLPYPKSHEVPPYRIEDISIHLLSGFISHPGSRHPSVWGTHLEFIACLMTKTPALITALRVTQVHRRGWRMRRRKGIMWCVGALHME